MSSSKSVQDNSFVQKPDGKRVEKQPGLLSNYLQELFKMSCNDSHYYRQVWYWGGEAKLRVEGKKMELTTIPANEWDQVVKDSEEFWDELAGISPRSAKVVQIFKDYSAVMKKAGVPYRYS